jgi:quercetin dioxygenase-like cupin family protein
MAESQRVSFSTARLAPEAPGISSRAIDVNGVRWAVVEYEPDVLRDEWCNESHSGYVLAGEIEYEFQQGDRESLVLKQGDGFTLGDGSAHRGRAGSSGARLFLIDRAG